MSITGEPDGQPGGGPQRAGVPMIDILTGLYASTAILAALRHRDRSGVRASRSTCRCSTSWSPRCPISQSTIWRPVGVPQRTGSRNPVTHPSGIYACRDGRIMIIAGNDDQFRRLCGVLDLPALAGDPRFASSPLRVANRAALDAVVEPAIAGRAVLDCLAAFEAAGLPAGPINDVGQVFADPQVQAREAVVALRSSRSRRRRLPRLADADVADAGALRPPSGPARRAHPRDAAELLGLGDGEPRRAARPGSCRMSEDPSSTRCRVRSRSSP